MIRRFLALGICALALAACNKGSSAVGLRLKEPSSVAVFWAFSDKNRNALEEPLLYPYVAVANTGSDELVLFDPVDDVVVSAPIIIRPLSIPFPSVRPAMVASAAFQPPEGATPSQARPDLLVAVAAGSSELRVIRTWKSANPNVTDPGLADDTTAVDLGGQVVALIATPAVKPGSTLGEAQIIPDRVRVIAALADNRLAVVEYQWTGDPTKTEDQADGGKVTLFPEVAAPTVQKLDFGALSLAVDASLDGTTTPTPPLRPSLRNPGFLYAASQDPIAVGVFGVAEFDMTGTVGAWTPNAIDAHTPTTLVAAFTLQERVPGLKGSYDQFTTPQAGIGDQSSFVPEEGDPVDPDNPTRPAVHRVYAYRDPASCGPQTSEVCGIAVLDPTTQTVAVNPWHTDQPLPPIAVPAIPVALLPGPPAWNPPADGVYAEQDPKHRFMQLFVATGARLTTGVLLIPTANGRTYVADLARWEIPSNVYEINPTSASLASVSGFRQSDPAVPQIGFYEPDYVFQADQTNNLSGRAPWDPTVNAVSYFKVTPGFTPDDTWALTYQGYLPAFAAPRTAKVDPVDGQPGQLQVALQGPPTATEPFTQVVNVYDPALGIRVGDIVQFWTASNPDVCPDTTQTDSDGLGVAPIEGKVVAVNNPDPTHPGGSLLVQQGDCVALKRLGQTVCEAGTAGPWTTKPGCWASLPGQQTVRIRAGGGVGLPTDTVFDNKEFVLVGASTGYAGRAPSIPTRDAPIAPQFMFSDDLADEPPRGTNTVCPDLVPYPLNALPGAVPESHRRKCEAVAVARKARRNHLTSVRCFKGTESTAVRNYCETFFPEFALDQSPDTHEPLGTFNGEPPRGPVLAFSLGVKPVVAGQLLVRDTQVVFTTHSGLSPVNRYGGGADGGPATGPMGVAAFDRSYDPNWGKQTQRLRFFVPHVGNLVLDATPSHSNGDSRALR